jgi:4-alpha-glucanotransferase
MEAAPALIRAAWSSIGALSIAPVQDVLNLGREARMNVPGHAEGNWRWRCPENIFSSPAFGWLQALTESTGRASASTPQFDEQPDPVTIAS